MRTKHGAQHRRSASYGGRRHEQSRHGISRTLEHDRDEVRSWGLTCLGCGHFGMVEISIDELRDAIIAGKVHCGECGLVRKMYSIDRGN